MSDIAAKLDEARALVEKGWCRFPEATRSDGTSVAFDDPDAVCFCVFGATCAVGGGYRTDLQLLLMDRIQSVVGEYPIWWNDAEGRTQAEVIEAFRKAAELARAEAQ